MTRADGINLLCVIAVLLCSLLIATSGQKSLLSLSSSSSEPKGVSEHVYERILSASVVADELLLELCEPSRIVGFTDFSQRHGRKAFRFAGKPAVQSITNLEAVLALRPDLVLVHSVGDPRPMERLKEAGITVHDFGKIEGLRTLFTDIRELSALVGNVERGEWLTEEIVDRLDAIASDIPATQRKTGLYIKALGNQIYGGSVGSSFHDMLQYGGLIDAAAERYRSHPNYSPEQVLAMDPEIIVVSAGTAQMLCARVGIEKLRACQGMQGVVEISPALLESAALGIVDAAKAIREVVYGMSPSVHPID